MGHELATIFKHVLIEGVPIQNANLSPRKLIFTNNPSGPREYSATTAQVEEREGRERQRQEQYRKTLFLPFNLPKFAWQYWLPATHQPQVRLRNCLAIGHRNDRMIRQIEENEI